MARVDKQVEGLAAPASGNRIHYIFGVPGFGVRVTTAGAKSFVLNYRTRSGRERRFTIGSFPQWTSKAALAEAAELRKRIDRGEDPMADIEADRAAKTVNDLCDRFIEEHVPRKRPSTARDYRRIIENDIRPVLKNVKVADVTFADIDGIHRRVTKRGAPFAANRTVAVFSKMLAQAMRWGWRSDNPAKGIERNHEEKRQRYLSPTEITALSAALAAHEDQQAANVVRLLLLTGCRRMEAMACRWQDLDLGAGVGAWTKPSSHTKQKAEHRIPLSAAARQLLGELREKASEDAEYVFPGRTGGHRVEIKRDWAALCTAAGLVDRTGRPTARVHDLRHTYASLLASSGHSLPIIGALLGHTQAATTSRYSHLLDDPLRRATESVGAIVSGKRIAEIVPFKEGAA